MNQAFSHSLAITLGGKDYFLRPTFKAITQIENSCGMGLFRLIESFREGSFTTTHMTEIIYATMREGDNPAIPTRDEIGEMLIAKGVANSLGEITALFMVMLGE